MTNDLEKAVGLLKEHGYTCVLLREERIYSSRLRGVRPLLELLDSPKNLNGFFAADKTVGLGAAHLYLLLGVSGVWARVISQSAKALLEAHGVSVWYDTLVPYIINRAGDGRCPIEEAVADCRSSAQALEKIRDTLKNLSKS